MQKALHTPKAPKYTKDPYAKVVTCWVLAAFSQVDGRGCYINSESAQ